MADETLTDSLIRGLKNSWPVAVLVLLLTAFFGFGKVITTYRDIRDFFAPPRVEQSVAPPAQPPPARTDPPTSDDAGSACNYVLVDGYRYEGRSNQFEAGAIEYRSEWSFADFVTHLDDTDVLASRLFVFKGYGKGPHRMDVTFVPTTRQNDLLKYSGAVTFSRSTYYRISWPSRAEFGAVAVRPLKITDATEADVRAAAQKREAWLPSCADLKVGVTMAF